MKIASYGLMIMVAAGLTLSGCCCNGAKNPTRVASNLINRQSVMETTTIPYPSKPVTHVAVYTPKTIPNLPYRVIGIAKISKRNLLGMQRENEAMHDMMKNLAASIGGDGVIDVSDNSDNMQGKVIAFQQILF